MKPVLTYFIMRIYACKEPGVEDLVFRKNKCFIVDIFPDLIVCILSKKFHCQFIESYLTHLFFLII